MATAARRRALCGGDHGDRRAYPYLPTPSPNSNPSPYPTPDQVIVVPTLLNCAKWTQRSKEDAEFVGDF